MAFNCISPTWFFGYSTVMELAFAIIALVLALFSYKIYKLTDQRQTKLFSASFFLISFSYAVKSVFNFVGLYLVNDFVCSPTGPDLGAIVGKLGALNFLGSYAQMALMLVGLSTLLYMTLGTKDKRMLLLMICLSIVSMLFTANIFYSFYVLSALMLAFISRYYVRNYISNRKPSGVLTAAAFILLTVGSVIFFFSVDNPMFFVIGSIFEFAAYVLILINLFTVLRK